jgi:plasmid maintenance system antidote protein VapI
VQRNQRIGNARRPLTANTALLFEAALGIEADTLVRIQTKYNMQTARKDKSLPTDHISVDHIATIPAFQAVGRNIRSGNGGFYHPVRVRDH